MLFIAPDHAVLTRLKDAARTVLAWNSIVEDVKEGRLNIDRLQEQQAKKELQTAEEVLPRVARECYKWLLSPVMNTPTDRQATLEAISLNTSGSSFGGELDRVCQENELIITVWSPVHLRTKLKELYWKPDRTAVGAMTFWNDVERYLYLPRLKNRSVLEQAITKGAATKDFFGTAYGHIGEGFDGFKFGDPWVQLDDTLLLIEPEAARQYEEKTLVPVKDPEPPMKDPPGPGEPSPKPGPQNPGGGTVPPVGGTPPTPGKAREFFGAVEINPTTAKMRLVEVADEIISVLASDPGAKLKVSVEITAEFEDGVPDHIKRSVSENATSLGFKIKNWD